MKKRRSYRQFVLSAFKPVRDRPGVYLDVQLKNRTALEQLRRGLANKDDIDMLIGAFNITEALAAMGKGSDWMDEIKQGQDALFDLSQRGVASGMRFIMTAKQWEALKLVMDLHEEQLAHATVSDIEKAHKYVLSIIRRGMARAIVEPQKEKP